MDYNANNSLSAYESNVVYTEKLTIEQYKNECDELVRFISSIGVKVILDAQAHGIKKLAYPVKGNKNGYFYTIFVKATKEQIKQLHDYYMKNEKVLKVLKFLNIKAED